MSDLTEKHLFRALQQRDNAWNDGDMLFRAVKSFLEDEDKEALEKAMIRYREKQGLCRL